MIDTDFSGQTVLVIGGSSGIGNGMEPDELAGAAIFLASPLSSYVVGETIIVDGGLTLS